MAGATNMAEERVERRLSAILAADIAGYSALMGADEAGTVRDLKGHQAVVLSWLASSAGAQCSQSRRDALRSPKNRD
jgi:class 3 adenylate cyclase